MVSKREKTISYRRAEWLNDDPSSINLGMCLKQAADKLKSVAERTIVRANGQQVKLVGMKGSKGGHLLHFTADTPGESASIVPKKAIAAPDEIQVGTAAPPVDAEFMDGDAFLYVNGNDVCFCATGLRDSTIRHVLQDFFALAKIRKDSTAFDLLKIADVSKVKLLQSQGVAEIELRSTLSTATVSYNRRKHQPQSIVGAAAKQFRAVLGKEHDVTSDALRVMLVIKTDRRRTGIALGEKRLKTLATSIINDQEDDDEYIIVTKGGLRIGPKEILMRSKVQIDSIGKSVQRDKAWKELFTFYEALEADGALEQ
ncbi:MAG: hypothetical protein QOJ96_689 [Alphaproteobacteria bacterium]|jgi:hypothetical protein|nr:hypothetical protein [Alphaproteobacteria bacterium]